MNIIKIINFIIGVYIDVLFFKLLYSCIMENGNAYNVLCCNGVCTIYYVDCNYHTN